MYSRWIFLLPLFFLRLYLGPPLRLPPSQFCCNHCCFMPPRRKFFGPTSPLSLPPCVSHLPRTYSGVVAWACLRRTYAVAGLASSAYLLRSYILFYSLTSENFRSHAVGREELLYLVLCTFLRTACPQVVKEKAVASDFFRLAFFFWLVVPIRARTAVLSSIARHIILALRNNY